MCILVTTGSYRPVSPPQDPPAGSWVKFHQLPVTVSEVTLCVIVNMATIVGFMFWFLITEVII